MNRPTTRWTLNVEAPELALALERIALAAEDRAELQVRRFCWWLALEIEDCGRSPAPFRQRVPDLHVLRRETCIARAPTWVAVLERMRGWSEEYIGAVPRCTCDIHPLTQPKRHAAPAASRARSHGRA